VVLFAVLMQYRSVRDTLTDRHTSTASTVLSIALLDKYLVNIGPAVFELKWAESENCYVIRLQFDDRRLAHWCSEMDLNVTISISAV